MSRRTKVLLTYLVSLLVALITTFCFNPELEGMAFVRRVFLQYIFISAAQSINLRILDVNRYENESN